MTNEKRLHSNIYCNREIREQVFEVLMDLVPDDVDPDNGRSGMGLWKILVLGTLRLFCNLVLTKKYNYVPLFWIIFAIRSFKMYFCIFPVEV